MRINKKETNIESENNNIESEDNDDIKKVFNIKNMKTKVWAYAIVLFTSAFIVLLIIGFSQIKYNRNLIDYKTQVVAKESENSEFKLNLNEALEQNQELIGIIEKKDQEAAKNNELIDKLDQEYEKYKNLTLSFSKNTELLSKAIQYYLAGDKANCAHTLKFEIDPSFLKSESTSLYQQLCDKTYEEAALLDYKTGLKLYREASYQEAMDYLNKSYELSSVEYFSDDCLFYMAYSAYNLGDNAIAKKYLNEIMQIFPDSSYENDIKYLLSNIDKL
jgi:tetratricopeptide (TPR) repeat protein